MTAPPTPQLAHPYQLRLVDPDTDAEMISEWMNCPHWLRRGSTTGRPSAGGDGAQVDGEYSRPFICSFPGRDLGYVELYRVAKDSIATEYDADPYDVGLHGVIAERELINRKVGPTVLAHTIASVFTVEPRCTRIKFDPDRGNKAARRVCEYAGSEFLGGHNMSSRRMALYTLPREPQDVRPRTARGQLMWMALAPSTNRDNSNLLWMRSCPSTARRKSRPGSLLENQRKAGGAVNVSFE